MHLSASQLHLRFDQPPQWNSLQPTSSEQLFRDAYLRFLIIFFLDSFILEINELEVFEKFITAELFSRKKKFFWLLSKNYWNPAP